MIKLGGQGISYFPLDLFIKKNKSRTLIVSVNYSTSQFERDGVFSFLVFFWKLNDFLVPMAMDNAVAPAVLLQVVDFVMCIYSCIVETIQNLPSYCY